MVDLTAVVHWNTPSAFLGTAPRLTGRRKRIVNYQSSRTFTNCRNPEMILNAFLGLWEFQTTKLNARFHTKCTSHAHNHPAGLHRFLQHKIKRIWLPLWAQSAGSFEPKRTIGIAIWPILLYRQHTTMFFWTAVQVIAFGVDISWLGFSQQPQTSFNTRFVEQTITVDNF